MGIDWDEDGVDGSPRIPRIYEQVDGQLIPRGKSALKDGDVFQKFPGPAIF